MDNPIVPVLGRVVLGGLAGLALSLVYQRLGST